MAVLTSTGFASALLSGQGFASIFENGVMEVRSGPQPVSADAPPTGQLLGYITRDGGAFTPGSPANGLRFVHNGRLMTSDPAQLWYLTGIASGVAGWFRLLGNAPDSGAYSLSEPRIDGAIGSFSAAGDIQLRMSSTTITPVTQFPINQWFYGMPPIGE